MGQASRGRITLVLGGARSGKSAFAQQLAEQALPPVLFVATAAASDEEMRARIAAHQAARPPAWRLLEAQRCVAEAARGALGDAHTILVDCLSLLVSNLVLADEPGAGETSTVGPEIEAAAQAEVRDLVTLARERDAALIVVSNEVGMSIVPPSPLGRAFRDALGRANQELAAAADAVYLVVAGIPIDVKTVAASGRSG
jgi:adenosylcobinamide kinase / adenosylcobinamide-phosphate guanylyltransferase